MAVTTKRKSAEERREAVLDAAYVEFAEHGLDGGSTEAIAAKAGISQPYVFRLFGTKKQLFIGRVDAVLPRDARRRSSSAAEGKRGEEALRRDGHGVPRAAPQRPDAPARADAGVRVVRRSGDSSRRPRRLRRPRHATSSGSPATCRPSEISRFFATGMLLNVIASMGLAEPGASRGRSGCSRAAANDRPSLFFTSK